MRLKLRTPAPQNYARADDLSFSRASLGCSFPFGVRTPAPFLLRPSYPR